MSNSNCKISSEDYFTGIPFLISAEKAYIPKLGQTFAGFEAD